MLLLKIKNNLSPLHLKGAAFFNLVLFSSSSSSSASRTLNPPPRSNHIAEYLISSCGFSSQKAASASKLVPKSASVEQAQSVRHFFKHHGFDDTTIRKLISNMPRILHADVDKTLKPNLQTLNEMGFARDDLRLLIASNPPLLVNPLAIPRIEFWQNFLETNDRKVLVRVFKRNQSLISRDIDRGIAPKIALLKEHGLSQTDFIKMLRMVQDLFRRSSKSIEALLKRAKELGLHSQSSSMFARALSALCSIKSSRFNAKLEIFMGFGWSEEEFLIALKKSPNILSLSEDNIRKKMEFLLGRVGCKQSFIASFPVLLALSLEKRLMPRYYVMEILKSDKIVGRMNLYSIMHLSEKKFVESIILPYKKQLPKILETYLAACAGQIPI